MSKQISMQGHEEWRVFANDDTGKWDVQAALRDEQGVEWCWIASFDIESDARLCAAAPEMLSRLQEVEKTLNSRGVKEWFPVNVRQAIQCTLAILENRP